MFPILRNTSGSVYQGIQFTGYLDTDTTNQRIQFTGYLDTVTTNQRIQFTGYLDTDTTNQRIQFTGYLHTDTTNCYSLQDTLIQIQPRREYSLQDTGTGHYTFSIFRTLPLKHLRFFHFRVKIDSLQVSFLSPGIRFSLNYFVTGSFSSVGGGKFKIEEILFLCSFCFAFIIKLNCF